MQTNTCTNTDYHTSTEMRDNLGPTAFCTLRSPWICMASKGTHLHASIVDKTNEVLSDEGKLKTLLYSMHLDYPQMGTPIQR